MPNIRVMNWNIRSCSAKKLQINGMASAIAAIIAGANVDLVCIVEVKQTNVQGMMNALQTALRAYNPVTPANPAPWQWILSQINGAEMYGFLIRDTNLLRPVIVDTPAGKGTFDNPIRDLDEVKFKTIPNATFAGQVPIPPFAPRFPVCNLFSKSGDEFSAGPKTRSREEQFPGQNAAGGGQAAGFGSRLQALAMFRVNSAMASPILPIVVCHYAAIGESKNTILSRAQIQLSKNLDIAQKFNDTAKTYLPGPPAVPASGYVCVDGAPVNIQELCFTGDYNVDFVENNLTSGANAPATLNRNAYASLTPILGSQGSNNAPGTALPPPVGPAQCAPAKRPDDAMRINGAIGPQKLRTAVTSRGTILVPYAAGVVLPPYARKAYDNFFYGGVQLSQANLLAGNESGEIVDVPSLISNAGATNPANINVFGIATYYDTKVNNDPNAGPASGRNVKNAPALIAPGTALNATDRLIGANMISDHLPVILQFPVP